MRVLVPAAALVSGRAVVTGDDHHYLFRVRRLAPGARLVVFDGEGGEADAEVESVEAAQAVLRLGEVRREPPAALHLTVIQGLIKGERMDWCVQKLVEVGADRIVLVATERSVVRLDGERSASRQARMQAIAREAAKQSHRAAVPPVEVVELAVALAMPAALRLVCHPAAARPLRDHLATPTRSAAILVGPEGGLSPGEMERAEAAAFEPVSLGRGILRAETAGVAAVSAFRIARD